MHEGGHRGRGRLSRVEMNAVCCPRGYKNQWEAGHPKFIRHYMSPFELTDGSILLILTVTYNHVYPDQQTIYDYGCLLAYSSPCLSCRKSWHQHSNRGWNAKSFISFE